jgi:integrase
MRLETVLPQTVNNDVIWLKAVLDTMKGVHNYKYDMTMFTPAYAVMRKEGIITKSAQRDRRPTSPELMILSRHFRRKPHYLHYMWFAIFSARRLSEIAKLRRSDIKHENRTILVRDMKSPKKEQLSLRAKLPRSAYKLIQRHGSKGDVIFPYNPKSVSTAFTRACKLLGIKDLVFHDLRHEATSRLFEAGLNIPQVQKVTLHQDWKSLARYTNLCHDDIDI